MKIKNVDTVHGVITIIHSKGDKDRAICLSEDVRKLCSQYKAWLVSLCPTSEWFFPGKYPEQHIPKTSVDRKFNEFWNATELSKIGIRDTTIMVILYDSAIRLSELLNLKISDVNLQKSTPYLRIDGKGDKERIVSISDNTVAHIKRYMRYYHEESILTMDTS